MTGWRLVGSQKWVWTDTSSWTTRAEWRCARPACTTFTPRYEGPFDLPVNCAQPSLFGFPDLLQRHAWHKRLCDKAQPQRHYAVLHHDTHESLGIEDEHLPHERRGFLHDQRHGWGGGPGTPAASYPGQGKELLWPRETDESHATTIEEPPKRSERLVHDGPKLFLGGALITITTSPKHAIQCHIPLPTEYHLPRALHYHHWFMQQWVA